jgi:hypothetical protein
MRWLLALNSLAFAAPVSRTVQLNADTICTINTALGHSTVLQLENRPVSVVVGDQDAYKVETVGNNITLKPLMPGARSNLFVFFGDRSFTFDLHNTNKTNPDYFVSVRPLSPKAVTDPSPPKIVMRLLNARTTVGTQSLQIVSIGTPPSNSAILMRFVLTLGSETKLDDLKIGFIQSNTFFAPSSIHFDQPRGASRNLFSGIALVRRSLYNQKHALFIAARLTDGTDIKVKIPTDLSEKPL